MSSSEELLEGDESRLNVRILRECSFLILQDPQLGWDEQTRFLAYIHRSVHILINQCVIERLVNRQSCVNQTAVLKFHP